MSTLNRKILLVTALTVYLAACGQGQSPTATAPAATDAAKQADVMAPKDTPSGLSGNTEGPNDLNNLYWGDTHLHTSFSPDAYVNRNTTVTPDDSYMFAKGAPVLAAMSKVKIQIDRPLDFLVVSDHAEYVGIPKLLWEGDARVANTEVGKRFIKMIADGKGTDVFFELIASVNSGEPIEELVDDEIQMSIWSEIVDAAERHNDPGKFTALIGWEWSSIPNGQNLHRIVFQPQGGDVAMQYRPMSAMDSDIEMDFWDWLEETSARTGADFVTIPHNGNISNGLMFPLTNRAGDPLDADYARTRMRWEQNIEVTQIKGDSETHPLLSPNDEFADFETYEHLIKSGGSHVEAETVDEKALRMSSYARGALLLGLEFEQKLGVNPFKYGLVGSTDSHNGYSSSEEDNFWGKFSLDGIPENKKEVEIVPGAVGWDMSASGMAAVWARDNTRAEIAAAFKRREVYGTSGPRIGLRFFGGFDFDDNDAQQKDIAKVGYAKGVPMGGDLTGAGNQAPSFLIYAVKDPTHANLDRVQVVKGWLGADGTSKEKVFDVSWSGDRTPGADGRLPAIGNTVDLKTGAYTNDIGAVQLATVWSDPQFDASQSAFYYVRVLQIPTPRNSTYDAIAMKVDLSTTGKALTIQERAYSSPIWYTPAQ